MNMTFYDSSNRPIPGQLDILTDFLYRNLDRYGDPPRDIRRAIEYALLDCETAGGFICVASEDGVLTGVVVVNRTGMEGYIPENILVYIAVSPECRGKGLGRFLLTETIGRAQGAIALHVEPDNPALRLYQRAGFTNKYLEMRLQGKEDV